MRFSLIIPLHRDSERFRDCLCRCAALDHRDFEILVVTDRPVEITQDGVRVILTGSPTDTSPAEKRDVAAAAATGDAFAYIDDDAYPREDWLTVAERALSRPGVRAVGGPGLTPPDSSLRCRAGGLVYSSLLGSGPLRYRFVPGRPRIVDDYPAYNLIVTADAVRDVGGWASTFYGGEDTRFCERLADRDALVHYDPDLVVFHYRRAMFRPHMRQIANVGRHRGYFARVHPGTSLRPAYFAPLAATLALIVGVAALLITVGLVATLIALGVAYLGLLLAAGGGSLAERALYPLGLVAHHASYGAAFARGLLTRDMDR